MQRRLLRYLGLGVSTLGVLSLVVYKILFAAGNIGSQFDSNLRAANTGIECNERFKPGDKVAALDIFPDVTRYGEQQVFCRVKIGGPDAQAIPCDSRAITLSENAENLYFLLSTDNALASLGNVYSASLPISVHLQDTQPPQILHTDVTDAECTTGNYAEQYSRIPCVQKICGTLCSDNYLLETCKECITNSGKDEIIKCLDHGGIMISPYTIPTGANYCTNPLNCLKNIHVHDACDGDNHPNASLQINLPQLDNNIPFAFNTISSLKIVATDTHKHTSKSTMAVRFINNSFPKAYSGSSSLDDSVIYFPNLLSGAPDNGFSHPQMFLDKIEVEPSSGNYYPRCCFKGSCCVTSGAGVDCHYPAGEVNTSGGYYLSLPYPQLSLAAQNCLQPQEGDIRYRFIGWASEAAANAYSGKYMDLSTGVPNDLIFSETGNDHICLSQSDVDKLLTKNNTLNNTFYIKVLAESKQGKFTPVILPSAETAIKVQVNTAASSGITLATGGNPVAYSNFNRQYYNSKALTNFAFTSSGGDLSLDNIHWYSSLSPCADPLSTGQTFKFTTGSVCTEGDYCRLYLFNDAVSGAGDKQVQNLCFGVDDSPPRLDLIANAQEFLWDPQPEVSSTYSPVDTQVKKFTRGERRVLKFSVNDIPPGKGANSLGISGIKRVKVDLYKVASTTNSGVLLETIYDTVYAYGKKTTTNNGTGWVVDGTPGVPDDHSSSFKLGLVGTGSHATSNYYIMADNETQNLFKYPTNIQVSGCKYISVAGAGAITSATDSLCQNQYLDFTSPGYDPTKPANSNNLYYLQLKITDAAGNVATGRLNYYFRIQPDSSLLTSIYNDLRGIDVSNCEPMNDVANYLDTAKQLTEYYPGQSLLLMKKALEALQECKGGDRGFFDETTQAALAQKLEEPLARAAAMLTNKIISTYQNYFEKADSSLRYWELLTANTTDKPDWISQLDRHKYRKFLTGGYMMASPPYRVDAYRLLYNARMQQQLAEKYLLPEYADYQRSVAASLEAYRALTLLYQDNLRDQALGSGGGVRPLEDGQERKFWHGGGTNDLGVNIAKTVQADIDDMLTMGKIQVDKKAKECTTTDTPLTGIYSTALCSLADLSQEVEIFAGAAKEFMSYLEYIYGGPNGSNPSTPLTSKQMFLSLFVTADKMLTILDQLGQDYFYVEDWRAGIMLTMAYVIHYVMYGSDVALYCYLVSNDDVDIRDNLCSKDTPSTNITTGQMNNWKGSWYTDQGTRSSGFGGAFNEWAQYLECQYDNIMQTLANNLLQGSSTDVYGAVEYFKQARCDMYKAYNKYFVYDDTPNTAHQDYIPLPEGCLDNGLTLPRSLSEICHVCKAVDAGSLNPGKDVACDGIDNDCDGVDGSAFGTTGTISGFTKDPITLGILSSDATNPLMCNNGVSKALAVYTCNHPISAHDNNCDNVDDNCDGRVDEEPFQAGFYGNACGQGACKKQITCQALPDGTHVVVPCAGGTDAGMSGAISTLSERCNGFDDNCNGLIEEDMDGDGYPAQEFAGQSCNWNSRNMLSSGAYELFDIADCPRIADDPNGNRHDDDPHINPGMIEICNGVDDNCDGEKDDGLTGICRELAARNYVPKLANIAKEIPLAASGEFGLKQSIIFAGKIKVREQLASDATASQPLDTLLLIVTRLPNQRVLINAEVIDTSSEPKTDNNTAQILYTGTTYGQIFNNSSPYKIYFTNLQLTSHRLGDNQYPAELLISSSNTEANIGSQTNGPGYLYVIPGNVNNLIGSIITPDNQVIGTILNYGDTLESSNLFSIFTNRTLRRLHNTADGTDTSNDRHVWLLSVGLCGGDDAASCATYRCQLQGILVDNQTTSLRYQEQPVYTFVKSTQMVATNNQLVFTGAVGVAPLRGQTPGLGAMGRYRGNYLQGAPMELLQVQIDIVGNNVEYANTYQYDNASSALTGAIRAFTGALSRIQSWNSTLNILPPALVMYPTTPPQEYAEFQIASLSTGGSGVVQDRYYLAVFAKVKNGLVNYPRQSTPVSGGLLKILTLDYADGYAATLSENLGNLAAPISGSGYNRALDTASAAIGQVVYQAKTNGQWCDISQELKLNGTYKPLTKGISSLTSYYAPVRLDLGNGDVLILQCPVNSQGTLDTGRNCRAVLKTTAGDLNCNGVKIYVLGSGADVNKSPTDASSCTNNNTNNNTNNKISVPLPEITFTVDPSNPDLVQIHVKRTSPSGATTEVTTKGSTDNFPFIVPPVATDLTCSSAEQFATVSQAALSSGITRATSWVNTDEGLVCKDYLSLTVYPRYVWVANTRLGTVSKIDMRSFKEVGRYCSALTTGADAQDPRGALFNVSDTLKNNITWPTQCSTGMLPSRMVTSRDGYVYIANYGVGGIITKIAERENLCQKGSFNRDANLLTSRDKNYNEAIDIDADFDGVADFVKGIANTQRMEYFGPYDECIIWSRLLKGDSDKAVLNAVLSPDVLASVVPLALAVDKDKNIWVGANDCYNHLLVNLEATSGRVNKVIQIPDTYAQGASFDTHGALWLNNAGPFRNLVAVNTTSGVIDYLTATLSTGLSLAPLPLAADGVITSGYRVIEQDGSDYSNQLTAAASAPTLTGAYNINGSWYKGTIGTDQRVFLGSYGVAIGRHQDIGEVVWVSNADNPTPSSPALVYGYVTNLKQWIGLASPKNLGVSTLIKGRGVTVDQYGLVWVAYIYLPDNNDRQAGVAAYALSKNGNNIQNIQSTLVADISLGSNNQQAIPDYQTALKQSDPEAAYYGLVSYAEKQPRNNLDTLAAFKSQATYWYVKEVTGIAAGNDGHIWTVNFGAKFPRPNDDNIDIVQDSVSELLIKRNEQGMPIDEQGVYPVHNVSQRHFPLSVRLTSGSLDSQKDVVTITSGAYADSRTYGYFTSNNAAFAPALILKTDNLCGHSSSNCSSPPLNNKWLEVSWVGKEFYKKSTDLTAVCAEARCPEGASQMMSKIWVRYRLRNSQSGSNTPSWSAYYSIDEQDFQSPNYFQNTGAIVTTGGSEVCPVSSKRLKNAGSSLVMTSNGDQDIYDYDLVYGCVKIPETATDSNGNNVEINKYSYLDMEVTLIPDEAFSENGSTISPEVHILQGVYNR